MCLVGLFLLELVSCGTDDILQVFPRRGPVIVVREALKEIRL